jgi:hypothetical protein
MASGVATEAQARARKADCPHNPRTGLEADAIATALASRTLLAKVTFARILATPAQGCPQACGGTQIHYDLVEWNCGTGPTNHEHVRR